jgi:site-specific recombinase XerC
MASSGTGNDRNQRDAVTLIEDAQSGQMLDMWFARMGSRGVCRRPHMHPRTDASQLPDLLRHTFVTTVLDAGVDLRGVQIAARHADPRTTMRYDRARNNLDRHPNYILAAYMASGT